MKYVVDLPFEITDKDETISHKFRTSGEFRNLVTLDAADAFYNLFVEHTDQILEGSIIRSSLGDNQHVMETNRNKQNAAVLISFSGSDTFVLPKGKYILRSTLQLVARYQDADWTLDIRDGIIGPQGLFSNKSDTQGFQSSLAVVPEPCTFTLLGTGLSVLLVSSWRRRMSAE